MNGEDLPIGDNRGDREEKEGSHLMTKRATGGTKGEEKTQGTGHEKVSFQRKGRNKGPSHWKG